MIDLAELEELARQAVLVALGTRALHALVPDGLRNEVAAVASAAAAVSNQAAKMCDQLAAMEGAR